VRLSTSDDLWEFVRKTLQPDADEIMKVVMERGKWERDELAFGSAVWMVWREVCEYRRPN